MVRWLAQIRTGPSVSFIKARYRFLSSAAFLTRYRIRTRRVKTIGGIQTMDENRPTSRWKVSAARVRKGNTDTTALLGDSRRDELHGVAHGVHRVGILVLDLDVESVLEVEDDVDQSGRVHLEVLEDVGAVPDRLEGLLVLDERLG